MLQIHPTPLVLLLGLLRAAAPGQDAPPAPQPEPAAPAEPAARDPFAADPALLELLGRAPAQPDDFQPLEERPGLPPMRLRGLVQMRGAERPAALVEIEGVGTYTTREGERLSFTLRGARRAPAAAAPPSEDGARARSVSASGGVLRSDLPIVLRVEHVGRDGVVVEVGSLGQYLVIR